MREPRCFNRHGVDLNPPVLEQPWTQLLIAWVCFERWGWFEVADGP